MKYNYFSNEPEDKNKRELFEFISHNYVKKTTDMYKNIDNIWSWRDPEGQTGLFKAVQSENLTMVVNIIGILKSKLNDLEFIKYMNEQNEKGLCLIHEASLRGNIELFKLLQDNGADVFSKTKYGLTCAHIACQTDSINLLIYLVESLKFDIYVVDSSGSLCIHWACYNDSEICVRYLFSKLDPTNYNRQDGNGLTFLHVAVIKNKITLIKYLVMTGVDYNIKDKQGRTALDLASKEASELITSLTSTNCLKTNVKQKKSNFNIYLFFLYHIVFEGLFFIYVLPCKILK